MQVDQILNKIEAVDASVVEITAQDVTGGEEIEEESDDDSSAKGSLEKFELDSQNFLGRIKEESIDIKSEPKDEPIVGIAAQDMADGVEEFKEADDDSQGRRTEPKIQADDQSEASVFYDAIHGNESLVMNFNWEESQLESESAQSEPDWLTFYKTQNGTRLAEEKDKPQMIRQPMSEVSPSEYTILESKRVQCNYCPRNLKHIRHIRNHIRQSHRDITNLYKCPYCPFTTKYHISVSKHVISKHKSHNELVYFECHTCGKGFKFKAILISHIKSHKTKEELMKTNEIHKCQVCNHLFRYKANLTRHRKNCHREKMSKKIQCYHCFYRYKDKISLISHIQKYHTPLDRLEILKCPKCNFTTKFDADLKYHKYNHHSQSFQCENCPYQSKWRSNLKVHCMTHHKKKAAITKTGKKVKKRSRC